MKVFGLPLALAALFTPALASADFFSYQTDEGVLAFTDDVKNVPSRYRDQVENVPAQSVFDYSRTTLVPRGATISAPWAAPAAEAHASPSTTPTTRLQISSNPTTTTLDLPAQTGTPVLLERTTEWRWIDGRYVPYAVVTHDGRVLSMVRLR